MGKATEDILSVLHGKLAEHMMKQLEGGELTSSDVSNIMKFLKDNGVVILPEQGDTMSLLLDSIIDADVEDTPKQLESKTDDDKIDDILKNKDILDLADYK